MRETGEQKESAVAPPGELLHLPFDRYGRCRIVADVLQRLGAERPLRVLNVGEDGAISDFLLDDHVVELPEPPGTGDVLALPFGDEAFDYVVSVDALGRVMPEDRPGYLSELRRTARRGVLLASPFDSEEVRGARSLADGFRHVHPPESPSSHADERLPDLGTARGFFEDQGDEVTVLPNGYLPHWLAMTGLSLYGEGLDGGVLDRVNAFYNEFIYGLDNAEPCYRRLLVCLKEPAQAADLDGLASPPRSAERSAQSSALFGTLSAVFPLTAEVRRLGERVSEYERRLSEKEGTIARKEAQVNDLSRRLANTSSLYEENAILAAQRDRLQGQIEAITNSRTWRMLALPRAIRRRMLRLRGSSG